MRQQATDGDAAVGAIEAFDLLQARRRRHSFQSLRFSRAFVPAPASGAVPCRRARAARAASSSVVVAAGGGGRNEANFSCAERCVCARVCTRARRPPSPPLPPQMMDQGKTAARKDHSVAELALEQKKAEGALAKACFK